MNKIEQQKQRSLNLTLIEDLRFIDTSHNPQTLEIFSKSIHYNRPQSNSQAQSSHDRSINSNMNKKKIKVSMATSDIIAVGIGVFGVIFLCLIITGNV